MNKKCVLDIETESLDPKTGRIICIGMLDVETKEKNVFAYLNEESMVKNFISYFNKNGFTEVIGFNVLFDVRFIFAKCLKYRISSRKFFSAKITDLMAIMKSPKYIFNLNRPGTLDEWCQFLFKMKKKLRAEEVPLIYQGGGLDEIVQYNKEDLEMTFRLWERIDYVMRID
jgi:DNA polymerase III epsilon subunit-like protein